MNLLSHLFKPTAWSPTMPNHPVMATPWLVVWAVALSWGWLLPMHELPWASFYAEAWVAVFLLVVAFWVLVRVPGPTRMGIPSLLIAGLAGVPTLQYWAGMHGFLGPVLLATAYLLAFYLSIVIAARWESAQATQLADGLFLAIGLAAVVSVGIQLHQWLELGRLLWDMGGGPDRPFANFGQPNMLATFLLCGVLATVWGAQRRLLGPVPTVLLLAFLLLGVALTGSRTAWLGVALLGIAVCFWRRFLPKQMAGMGWLIALALYFVLCVYFKSAVRDGLLLPSIDDFARLSNEARLPAWRMFIDAVAQRPWFGYGWGLITKAYQEVALSHPATYILFTYAHNIVLDLMLWCGVPLALAVCFSVVWWFWRSVRAIQRAEDALLLMLVVVVANHALLEFPLTYAYLLLPMGLVIGVLSVRLQEPLWRMPGRWFSVGVAAGSAIFLVLLLRDYARVEDSYRTLRLEAIGMMPRGSTTPPDVILLDHMAASLRYGRYQPHKNMSADELAWTAHVVDLFPGTSGLYKAATAMAWHGQPARARVYLARLCSMAPQQECEAVRLEWARQALTDADMAAVAWPILSN